MGQNEEQEDRASALTEGSVLLPPPPEGSVDDAFLSWVQEHTERAWAAKRDPTIEDYLLASGRPGGQEFRKGTRWGAGLTEEEIDNLEANFNVTFPQAYRNFLGRLHHTTPRQFCARYVEDELQEIPDGSPGFYNWIEEAEEVRRMMIGRILDGVFFDIVVNGVWLSSWGPCPDTIEDKIDAVALRFAYAPPLIPIECHRYLVPVAPFPVLSVYQTDVILLPPVCESS